jgi:hypothetical protein
MEDMAKIDRLMQNQTGDLSLPEDYLLVRRYFVLAAHSISIVFLTLGILILLGNR